MKPSEDDLAAAPVADAGNVEVQRTQACPQRARRYVNQVARKIQCEPGAAESRCLQAGGIRHHDQHEAARGEQSRGAFERRTRLSKMLERMPKDNGRPLAFNRVEIDRAHVRTAARPFDSKHLTAAVRQGVYERAIAGADIQDRSRRRDCIDTASEAAAGLPKQRIESAETAFGRPVPPGIGVVELGLTRLRQGAVDAAGAAARNLRPEARG
jgi:hypothetical protein